MKRLHFFLALTISTVILSCSKEDPGPNPTKKLVIELQIPPQTTYGEHDVFIIATSPEGVFLGLKKIMDGQNIVIDTAIVSLPDKVNITLFYYSPPNPEWPTDHYTLYTETDVPTGSKWYFAASEGFWGMGSTTINISNFPAGSFCSISSLAGSAESRPIDTELATLSALIFQYPADLFVGTTGTSQDPRYFKAASVSNGTILNLDYNADFLPFDHVINVLPDGLSWLAMSRGYNTPVAQIATKDANTHEFGFFFGTNNNGLRLGFNDGYSSYWSWWVKQSTENTMAYEKWGRAPDQSDFAPVEGDFTITKENFNGFDYITTGQFHYLVSEFRNENSARAVWWSTLRPVGSRHAIMDELPEALLHRFPNLSDLDLNENLGYTASTFFRTTTEKAKDLYIERKQSTGVIILEGETWSIRK